MYKYAPKSVVKISMMFAKYFEYYTIILRGTFFRGHAVHTLRAQSFYIIIAALADADIIFLYCGFLWLPYKIGQGIIFLP